MSTANPAAFAAIANPIKPDRVQVFRSFPKTHTLGFEQRPISGGAGTYVTRGNSDPESVPSTVLLAPSSIVALKYDDTINVFAVTAENKRVALVSPFVEPVSPEMKSSTGYIAGCTNGTNAWIYFQNTDEKNQAVISWSDVSDSESNNDTLPATDIKPNTWLSAFWDSESSWVLFQENGGRVVAYNTNMQQESPVNRDSKIFIDLTPIGSTFIPAAEIDTSKVPDFNTQDLGRAFVYWINSINGKLTLYRAHADIKSGSATTTFSDPVQVTSQAIIMQKNAQISILADTDAHVNRVFVAKSGDKDKISLVSDNFFYPKKKAGER